MIKVILLVLSINLLGCAASNSIMCDKKNQVDVSKDHPKKKTNIIIMPQ